MGEAGLFAHERVELLDGTIVTMSPHCSPHAGTVDQLTRLLLLAVGRVNRVRAQLPIILDDWSEPEPDVTVCLPDRHHYVHGHPTAAQVLLVCEVASSSVAFDRSVKAAAYAASGIPEYWVIDLDDRGVHVLRDPDRAERHYRSRRRAGDGDVLVALGTASLAVSEILPPV